MQAGKAHVESGHDPGALRSLSHHIKLDDDAEQSRQDNAKGVVASETEASARATRKKPFFATALGMFDDLSKYLRTRGRTTSLQPSLADKLKKSTWEHARTATRAAKAGNKAKAKLYTDLADNAMKEAARYMSADDFRAFRRDVEDSLKGKSDAS